MLLPWLNRSRLQFLSDQIQQASELAKQGQFTEAEAILHRADWLSLSNPQVKIALGKTYEQAGEYSQAIKTYQALSFQDGYDLVGQAALTSQDYALAQSTYQKATKDFPSAHVYTQLAIAQFNLNQNNQACDSALSAAKAELASQVAQDMEAICLYLTQSNQAVAKQFPSQAILSGNDTRRISYFLIQHGLLKIGEQRLDQTEIKTTQDWLTLAQIAAQRGDFNTAISRAEEGIKLNSTDINLNQFLLKIYQLTNSQEKLNFYQQRLIHLFQQ